MFTMPKYKVVFQQMLMQNQELFDNFKAIHDAYVLNPEVNQAKFNQIGSAVQDIIRHYERILCGKSEGGSFSKFSGGLSEKFWNEIRSVYPKIDFVGIK